MTVPSDPYVRGWLTMKERLKAYFPAARRYLNGKKWTKAWRVAKALDITPQLAGMILSALPEWELWNPINKDSRRKRPWYRPDLVVIDE